jgi:transcriptional regulator with XRE-family HTH domain
VKSPGRFAPTQSKSQVVVERIRRAKKTHNLTNARIAEALGVHQNTVSKWLRLEQPIAHPQMAQAALDALVATL